MINHSIPKSITAKQFVDCLVANDVLDFTGVPCSIFKDIINYLEDYYSYIPASSEGEAMGIAAGVSLSNRIPAVLMQNDGFGNAINPLTSLQKLYDLPTLLIISWRGKPGEPDAPQHFWSGKTLIDQMALYEIEHVVLEDDFDSHEKQIVELLQNIREKKTIGALICQKGTFLKEEERHTASQTLMSCNEAITVILEELTSETAVFSTTGSISRELHSIANSDRHFYSLGSMGCVSSIAFGFQRTTNQSVVVLDGDGSILMKMGTLATIGYHQPDKLLHICLDNESYHSTGGQRSATSAINLSEVAQANNYRSVEQVNTIEGIRSFIQDWKCKPKLSFLHIKVSNVHKQLPERPAESPLEIKHRFMVRMVPELNGKVEINKYSDNGD